MGRPLPNDLGGPAGPEPASEPHLSNSCTASCDGGAAPSAGNGSWASEGREGAGRVL